MSMAVLGFMLACECVASIIFIVGVSWNRRAGDLSSVASNELRVHFGSLKPCGLGAERGTATGRGCRVRFSQGSTGSARHPRPLSLDVRRGGSVDNPNEALASRFRSGQIMAFLWRDLFTVQLDDGITITAVVPEEFFPVFDINVPLTRINRPSVEIEMREPPAWPRIVQVSKSSFCGPGY